MKKKIIICHLDQEYSYRLMNYINRYSNGQLLGIAEGDLDKATRLLQEKSADGILLAEELIQTFKETECGNVFLLTEDKPKMEGEIYRYDTAKNILEEVSRQFLRDSISGEMGVSWSVLFVLGDLLKLQSIKADPSMELFSENCVVFHMYPSAEDFAESRTDQLIYEIKNQNETLKERLPEFVTREEDGYRIAAPRLFMDLRSLTSEDIGWFSGILQEAGYGQLVILLHSSCIREWGILKNCRELVFFEDERMLMEQMKEQILCGGVMEEQIRWMKPNCYKD